MNRHACHIVIVEDNEPDLVMIQFSLRDAGVDCDITSFSDGAEALRYVNDPSSRVPDLMILDFNIPNVEGTVILNSVRGNPRWAAVGVFMFTASQDPADIGRVKRLGADKCLIKPMDLAGFAEIGRAAGDWLDKAGKGLDKTGNESARGERA
jgi:DNA-binding response OmpR family regulator